MKNTVKRAGNWISSHKEEIAVYGILTGLVALVVAAEVAEQSAIQRAEDERMGAIRNANEVLAGGGMILPNTDGSFWVVGTKTN